MITAKIIGDVTLSEKFMLTSSEVAGAAEASIGRSCLRLMSRVKKNKLSGQVLNARTGRGRRSINQRVVKSNGEVSGYVGTNVKYMEMHEEGGVKNVKAHLRLVKQAFGKALKTPVWANVSAHEMKVSQRSFLKTALVEMQTEIIHDLNASINRVLP